VDLILDGGSTPVGIESTVVSLAEDPPVLFRPGMISREELEELIGPIRVAPAAGAGAHSSPGMHSRHYSPQTRMLLVVGGNVPSEGRGIYLKHGERMPSAPAAYAATLYATLHSLDQQGYDWIAVENPPSTPEWTGIRDRLRRASDSL